MAIAPLPHLPSYRQLLATADIRMLLLTTLLSRLAGRMFALTIVLYGVTQVGSTELAGWLAFAAVAPGLLISPIAGSLIDSLGSAWAITVDLATSAVFAAALAAAAMVGCTNAAVLLALTGCFSLTSPLSFAGIRALLPRLVSQAALDRANALDTAINGLTDVAGPALAGLMVGFGRPSFALGMIAAIYAVAAGCIGQVRRPRGSLPRIASLLSQAWHGLRRVLGRPTLRGLALSYALYEVCWGMLIVIVPVFAAQHFTAGMGATVAGLLWAGLGLVGGTTALVAGHLRAAGRERRLMAVGMMVTALAVWPIAARFGLTGLVVGLMLVGAAAGPIDVGVLTLRQRRTDPTELGRVVAISMSLNWSGGPIGSALAGLLVGWSLPGSLSVAAVASLLGAWAVALIPSDEARLR
ncbi:MAG TPA: MFS transporter [Acetobacteraceae bacterium]|nr:MFS transporter [Acetobacteraceae bacterium]